MHTDCAKWWYSSLLCGVEWASYVIKTELPHLYRVTPRGRLTRLFLLPILLEFIWEICSDPDMTAPK